MKTSNILEKILLAVFCGIILAAPFSKHTLKLLYYSVLALWLALNILKYRGKFYGGFFPYTSFNRAIAVFFLATVISTIFSLNPYHSQEILFQRYTPYFILFFLGVKLTRSSSNAVTVNFFGRRVVFSNLHIIMGSFLLLSVFINIGGVWDYFRYRPDRLWTVFGREVSFKMLPVYLVYLIPLNAGLFIYTKNKLLKLVSLINFGLLFFVLICTGSRGALVAVATSLILVVLLSKKKRYIFFFLSLVIVTTFIMPQHYRQRAKDILYPFSKNTFVSRKGLFGFAVDIFTMRPAFGAGIGMYEVLPSPAKKFAAKETHLHAHNTYLEVLCEIGIVGLLAFLWIFVLFFKKAFRTIRLCRGNDVQVIQIGLIGLIFASLIFALSCTIITVGFQDAVIFWLLFGVSCGLISKDTKQTVLSKKVLT